MTNSTQLIVLHTTKFSENSLVVHTISKKYGRRGFLVRGLGKNTSMSMFLPLNILEADIVENSKTKLFLAKNIHSLAPLNGLRDNIYKNTIGLFLSEVLFRAIKEGGLEEGLYEWCAGQIMLLDALKSDWSNFHLRFLLELSVQMGFAPSMTDLMPFAEDNLEILEKFMSSSFSESMLIPLSGCKRSEIADSLLRYIAYHSESALNIRSLEVLREIF